MPNFIAIGNALVDTEFSLTEEVLARTQLVRGNMTLADTDAQAALFKILAEHNIRPTKQSGGGSAANTTAVVGALGSTPFYHCRVADDAMGNFYLDDLAKFGVATNRDKALAQNSQSPSDKGVTGSCAVLVTADGERTMQTHLGVSASLNDSNIDFDTLHHADWLYIEGYLAMSPDALAAISKLRQQAGVNGVGIVVSFADPAVVKFAKDGLMQILGNGVDIIFCNLEEAQLFTEKKQHKACVKALLAHAHKMVVVTNGKEPTIIGIHNGDQEATLLEVPSVPANVVDTNGAGDNFAGAYMYALSEFYPVEKCAEFASHVAAKVVEQFGARLTKEAYLTIKAKILN